MADRLKLISCGLLLSGSVLTIGLSLQLLAEAVDDGWPLRNPAKLTEFAVAIAPFGLFPVVTSTLVGFVYWATMKNRSLSFQDLGVNASLLAISFTFLGVAAEVTKDQLHLDGWRDGTVLGWIVHSTIAAVLVLFGFRELRTRNVQATARSRRQDLPGRERK